MLDEKEEPRLVVNAMITAGADSQQVHIRTTGLARAENASAAEVSILILMWSDGVGSDHKATMTISY